MANKLLLQFSMGVFGLAARLRKVGEVFLVEIHVNERTDQEKQKKIAGIDPSSPVRIIDCPGGGVQEGETPMEALVREIREETCGCTIESLGNFSEPLFFLNKDPSKPSDAAMWMPIKLFGEPQPSNEALSHPWITLEEFEAEFPYRPVSGKGKLGRTGQMMHTGINWFMKNQHRSEIFS